MSGLVVPALVVINRSQTDISIKCPLQPLPTALDLFASLNRPADSKIERLWPVQIDIIDRYFISEEHSRFLAVELPTGSGKSVISLILLKYWLDQHKRVAILTSSNALSEQLQEQARQLGISTAIIRGTQGSRLIDPARTASIKSYNRALSVGIINYWEYLYGTEINAADILVVDDADSFESVASEHYSLSIWRSEDETLWYATMYELGKREIYKAKLESFDFKDNSEDAQLVYFTDSYELAGFVRKQILAGMSTISKQLRYSFIRNKDKMESSLMFISGDQITFVPMVSPIASNERLSRATQVILMSATLGTEEMVHRILGTEEPIALLMDSKSLVPFGTMGIRLAFPVRGLSFSKDVIGDALAFIEQACNRYEKALVVCTSIPESHRVADYLTAGGHAVQFYKTDGDVEAFSKMKSGVLISGGRLMGLDLPDETCRIEVLSRMSFFVSIRDTVFDRIMGDEDYVRQKKANRLCQALGRCNRGPTDYASYFVLDGRLATDITGEGLFFRYLPRGLQAELDYGQEVIDTHGVERALSLTDELLKGETKGVKEAISQRLSSTFQTSPKKSPRNYTEEIKGWNHLFTTADFLAAAKAFENCISDQKDPLSTRTSAWYHYLAAHSYYLCYMRYGEERYKEACVGHLENAIGMGQRTWFSGLRLVLASVNNQAHDKAIIADMQTNDFRESVIRSWEEFFDHISDKNHNPDKRWGEIRSQLLKGSHGQVADSLKTVLDLLGYETRRLDKKQGEPDVIMIATNVARYLVLVEIKTREEEGVMVGTDAVGDVLGYVPMYESKYPGQKVVPVIFTNKDEYSDVAMKKATGAVKLIRAKEFDILLVRLFELMKQFRNIGDIYMKAPLMTKIPTPAQVFNLFNPIETQLSPDQIDKVIES